MSTPVNPSWTYSLVAPPSGADVKLLEAHLWNDYRAALAPELIDTWACKTFRNLLHPEEYARTIGIILWGRHRAVAPLRGATEADVRALLAFAPSVYQNLRSGRLRRFARSTESKPERYHRYTRYVQVCTVVDEQTGLMQLAETAGDFTEWGREIGDSRERMEVVEGQA